MEKKVLSNVADGLLCITAIAHLALIYKYMARNKTCKPRGPLEVWVNVPNAEIRFSKTEKSWKERKKFCNPKGLQNFRK